MGINEDYINIIVEKIYKVNDVKILSLISDKITSQSINKEKYIDIGAYTNWEASCYLDSLLMIFFISDESQYFMNIILNTDISKIMYNPIVCEEKSSLSTSDQIKDFAVKIQHQLLEDYDRIVNLKDVIECTNIRKLFSECQPSMLGKKLQWIQISPGNIYRLLTELFSDLSSGIYPQISMPSEEINMNYGISTFMTSDYMLDPADVGFSPLWENFTIPYITFMEGVISEDLIARYFDETILGGKYELYASVVMQGNIPKSARANKSSARSKGHYISYFKVNGSWVIYDDQDPRIIEKLDELPEMAYRRLKKSIPELLFYKFVA